MTQVKQRMLILQPLHRFTYATAHSPTLPPLYLHHSSFYNPSDASTTSQALHLCHGSFSNPSAALPTSQVILQPFLCSTYVIDTSPTSQRHRHFTYVTVRSPTIPPLHLRHSSFYNPSAASPTSQVILQTFRCFTYVTGTSRTSPGKPPMHRGGEKTVCDGLACYCKLLSLEVPTILDTSSKLIFLQSYSVQCTRAQEWHIVSLLGDVTSPTTVAHYVTMTYDYVF